jgi:hypothetical protein
MDIISDITPGIMTTIADGSLVNRTPADRDIALNQPET